MTLWAGTAARVAVGGVFAVSGWQKITDIGETIRSVRNYRLLPEAVVPTIGTALPALELVLEGLLLAGLLTRTAAAVTIPLSAAFLIGVSSAWARGLQIECGCFGNGGTTSTPVPGYVRELLLNALIIAACAWLVRHPVTRWSLDGALGLTAADGDADDDDGHDGHDGIPDEPTDEQEMTYR